MSLPLTRRIAKTVLLTAAGAASVVGAAGAASAAELPSTADVGGLSKLDQAAGQTVRGTATEGVQALTPMSSSTPLDNTSGAARSGVTAVGNDTDRVAPETRQFAGETTTGAAEGLQKQAPKAENLPTKQLPAKQVTGKTTQPSTLEKTVPVKGGLLDGQVLPKGLGTASIAGL
ncbi:ATP-binding protein [Streptomyces abyssalis]|uniref:ATP-binding protein n=1 Tax=Streptomyces abyssalis TaxID=933944 RepID=UPI000ADACDC7|nr:ATP-binding protein [Streptomyces abyssalis]